MEQPKRNFFHFLKSPLGTVLVFLVLFYAITFGVYYFYSPGPEERKQAEQEIQNRMLSQQIQTIMNSTLQNVPSSNSVTNGTPSASNSSNNTSSLSSGNGTSGSSR